MVPHTNKEQVSGYQLGVLHLGSILTLSTQRQHQAVQLTDCCTPLSPPQDARCKAGCYLCFWPTGLLISFSRLPSWVWLICQGGSQNSEKNFYTLDDWFIIKRTARWKRHTGQGMGRQRRDNKPPPACHSPHFSRKSPTGSSLNPVLVKCCGGFIT